jgi:drug/metabolite transporter (DMT)-like permease
LLLFFITGSLQPVIRLLTYAAIYYMGASRGTTVRGSHPLFSTSLAIFFLGESANVWIVTGTVLIVVGVTLISWQPASDRVAYRWWHVMLPLGAALLAGISHPIRRYALGLANEPLFYAATVGWVSLFWMSGYLMSPLARERPAWSRQALVPFIMAGIFETLGILLVIFALSVGAVVDRFTDRSDEPAMDSRRHRTFSSRHRKSDPQDGDRRALRGRRHNCDFARAMNSTTTIRAR